MNLTILFMIFLYTTKDVSFYRERNPSNLNDYPIFHGQTGNPLETVLSDNESYFGEDEQPEIFAPENRKNIIFNRFEGFERNVNIFKLYLILKRLKITYLIHSFMV